MSEFFRLENTRNCSIYTFVWDYLLLAYFHPTVSKPGTDLDENKYNSTVILKNCSSLKTTSLKLLQKTFKTTKSKFFLHELPPVMISIFWTQNLHPELSSVQPTSFPPWGKSGASTQIIQMSSFLSRSSSPWEKAMEKTAAKNMVENETQFPCVGYLKRERVRFLVHLPSIPQLHLNENSGGLPFLSPAWIVVVVQRRQGKNLARFWQSFRWTKQKRTF